MFLSRNFVKCSDFFDDSCVAHGFATREGGVSTIPSCATMNTAVRMGDTQENVTENVNRLAKHAGMNGFPVVYSHQIHSNEVRYVTPADALISPEDRECDGYITDVPGVALLVRSADCLPILFSGKKADGAPVVAATHAGWRGTVGGIAAVAIEKMISLGAVPESIRVAIGPAIKECCFTVREDFIEAVTDICGADFAARHIKKDGDLYRASLQGMNIEFLEKAGVSREKIDLSPDCTACNPHLYHSHRATAGERGTGGGIIGIKMN